MSEDKTRPQWRHKKIDNSDVTLNGSIRIGCVNVYIKDNMLLAPPSHKSLKSLSEIINLKK